MNDILAAVVAPYATLLSPAQLRGARAMLDWSMLDLAQAANVSVSTIKRMESAGAQPLSHEMQAHVRRILEQAGVRFATDAAQGQGVWLAPA